MRLGKKDVIRLYPLKKRMKQGFTLVENLEKSIVFSALRLGREAEENQKNGEHTFWNRSAYNELLDCYVEQKTSFHRLQRALSFLN